MNVAQISSAFGGVAPSRELLSSADGPKAAGGSTAAERKKVGAQFEAVLVRQLLSQSIGSMLGGSDNVAGTVYGDMMTDAFAQQLTAGPGLGLGRFIERQLTPRGTPVDGGQEPTSHASRTPLSTQAHP